MGRSRNTVAWALFVVMALAGAGYCVAGDRRTQGKKQVEQDGNAYQQWENGPPVDASYFPIAVWLQDPRNAERYKAAGINLYVGLWKGPTEEQLAALRDAGMKVVCSQNRVGLAHQDDPTIVAWMHNDEPDNAQAIIDPKTGERGWGGPVPPPRVVEDYHRLQAQDETRPIFLNLGQGVANDEWKGRGRGAHIDDYLTYVQGADVVSFDVYPVVGIRKPDGENYLWYVAKGVSRLVEWSGGEKIIWNCIECTHISDPPNKATPHQVRAEVWMSLIHGSTGIVYFVHQFQPTFNEHALLDDPEMLPAVTEINRQIHELAPVLNSPSIPDRVTVQSSDENVPIAAMVKELGGATYLLTVGMRNGPTTGRFDLKGVPDGAEIEVLGEGRRLQIRDGRFSDAFAAYDVHLYRIR
jgi:hypothetical protein